MNSKPKFYKHFLADKIPLITAAVLMLAVSMLPGILVSEILKNFIMSPTLPPWRYCGASDRSS